MKSGKDRENPQEKVKALIQKSLFSDPKGSHDAARQLSFYLFQSPEYNLTTRAIEEMNWVPDQRGHTFRWIIKACPPTNDEYHSLTFSDRPDEITLSGIETKVE